MEQKYEKNVFECSTPFGITEVGITIQCDGAGQTFKCSTPFGITEVGITM